MGEEADAAESLGEILTSSMFRACNEPLGGRKWLYIWERRGLRWLIRYRDRTNGGSVGNDWIAHFIELNREAILSDHEHMDFNLKADDERKRDAVA